MCIFTLKFASSLYHFSESPHCFQQLNFYDFNAIFQGLNNTRSLSSDNIHLLLDNLSTYMNCISLETSAAMWTNILNQFDTFFARLTEILSTPCDMTSVLKIITCLLKVSGINNAKVCCSNVLS